MSGDWKLVNLSDVSEMSAVKIDVGEVDINNFISTENLKPDLGGVELSSGVPSSGKISKFQKGDILFSNIRTYFRKVWYSTYEGGCSNDVIVFRSKGVDNKYLYYVLADTKFIDYTTKTAKGTKMPRGDKHSIKNYKLHLPPLQEQKNIAHVLGTLDDKIELNRKMNETLEQMAQALFTSWFVDFDPVIDNALTAGNDIPEELQRKVEKRQRVLESGKYKKLSKDIMDLFPASFEYSDELGKWVPEGWEVSTYGEEFNFFNGNAFKSKELLKEKVTDDYSVFKMGNILRGGGLKLDGTKSFYPRVIEKKILKYLLRKGDVLMAMTDMKSSMALLGHTALMSIDHEFLLNQRVGCLRVKNSEKLDYSYLYIHSNRKENIDEIRSRSNSGVQVNLSSEQIKLTKILVPSYLVHREFNVMAVNMFNRTFQLQKEINSLTATRDLLLPQLISGKLKVKSNN